MKVETFNYPCPSCGAAQIYSPKTKTLICDFCKTSTNIKSVKNTTKHLIENQDTLIQPQQYQDNKEINCKKCGASFTQASYIISTKCPYCKTPILTSPSKELPIDAILPFQITHKEAQKAFKKWVGSLWFAPTAFTKYLNGDNKLIGSYIPHFFFDGETTTYYNGQRGDAYYITVNKTIRDEQGNPKTVQVQERHIRWSNVSGVVDYSFRDISIPASKDIDYNIIDNLEKWDIKNIQNNTPQYLSGFQTEEYTIPLKHSFEKAKNKIKPKIYNKILRDIGGDEQRIDSFSTKYIEPKYQNTLLPVWIASFKWNNKYYDYAVNGYNAKVSGERPYSIIKIISAVIALVAIITALYFISQTPSVQEFLSQFQHNEISYSYTK